MANKKEMVQRVTRRQFPVVFPKALDIGRNRSMQQERSAGFMPEEGGPSRFVDNEEIRMLKCLHVDWKDVTK